MQDFNEPNTGFRNDPYDGVVSATPPPPFRDEEYFSKPRFYERPSGRVAIISVALLFFAALGVMVFAIKKPNSPTRRKDPQSIALLTATPSLLAIDGTNTPGSTGTPKSGNNNGSGSIHPVNHPSDPTHQPQPTATCHTGMPTTQPKPTSTPIPRTQEIDDPDPLFSYAGSGWTHQAGLPGNFYLTTASYDATAFDASTITIQGNRIEIVGDPNTDQGIMGVYLDNNPVEHLVDLYASLRTFQQVVFDSGNIGNGTHTVKMVVTGTANVNSSGTNILIDAVIAQS